MCKKSLLMMLLLALFAPWAAKAQNTVTVYENGTAVNEYVPFYGYWADAVQQNQMIFPASELTAMVGQEITQMVFYIDHVSGSNNIGNWIVSLGETTATTLESLDLTTPLTEVYSGAMNFNSGQTLMTVTFGVGYTYNGGNLLVEFNHPVTASYKHYYFTGAEVTGAAYTYGSQRNFLPKVTFSYQTPATCPKPTGLAATLTEGDGTVASLSWTENGSATAWQICLNGDETNLIAATTNPWQLTGLTPETTYTAKVRAYCSAGDQSEWSNEVTFKPSNAISFTANDGTIINEYVPIYGYWCDNTTKSQFIIPARELADMAWGTITKMTFYTSAAAEWGSPQFEVYMTETAETTLSALADYTTMQKVMNARVLNVVDNQMVVEFDTPYQYSNGNLMIGFLQTASGSYAHSYWYGVSATGASMGGYGSSISQQNFLPKTTFGYLPGEAPSCLWPTNLAVSNIGARSVELSWTENGEATTWNIGYQIVGEEEQYVEVTENPYTLTGLTPETDYQVRVQSKCSDTEYSVFTSFVDFTTDVACPAPTDLVISDITASSANVAWTGDDGNYQMEYAIAGEGGSTTFDFEDGTLQGWTNLIVDATGGHWLHSNDNLGGYDYTNYAHSGTGFAMSYSYVDNGGGAFNTNAYLVSPNRYQIGGNASLNFWYDFANDAYPDHMEVCVATAANPTAADFTPIWSWDGAKRSNGLRSANGSRQRNNTRYGNWTEVTLDLNAYAGQNIWIAFHHVDYDMYEVWVDDVTVNTGGELTWIPVGTVTSPYAFGNLEAETTYMVRVRANCTDGYDSQWLTGTFTTLPLCMVPTNLAISNIDKRSADLAWTANGDEEAWQISLNDGTNEQIIDVTATTYSFTGLTPETRYTVKVRAYCDADLQSAWSMPITFTTLVACPAPTGLAISDITNVSAVATWTYEGDVELEYAVDPWLHYDNGVYVGGIGTGGSDVYWAIMLPPTMLTNELLSKVAVYEASGYNTEPLTIMVYSGGDTAPGTLLYEETVTPEAANAFHEIALAEPVTFDATQNLWIVCKEYGTYPANGCVNTGDANGRWISLDGTEWEDVTTYNLDYTWMIRAGFGDVTTEWVAVNNPASPQTIAGLTPETNYMVRLRAVCGGEDGESVWVTTSFTTDEACPAPTALGATPYALSAVLSWEGISESYTVRYGIVEVGEILSSFDFEDETIPADFTNSTTYPWTVTEGGANESGYCVIPGNAGVNSSTSDLTLQVTGPCSVSFMAKVSSENNYDWGRFFIDGTQQMQISGTKDWESYSYTVAAGTHTLVWRYYKDSSSSSNDDLFYVDNIVINEMSYAWETTTATTNECTITGLTPMTTYYAQVMGDCGDYGTSQWSEIISFTTTNDLCPVPTNLTVNNETLTATTADLSWAGSPDVESFTVRYRAPEHAVEGSLYETFGTTIPTGWTMYTGLLDTVMVRPSALTANDYAWSFGTGNGVFDNHARVNIYSTYQRWLVTPEVTVAAGANLAFDMALTVWSSSSSASPTPGNQADDKFIVLISTDNLQTWNILRQWDNQGSEYVYDEITNDANGQPVSIDLSAYVGQTVHIAFYGESTVSGGDNNLHIDNVLIGTLIPATDWQTVTTTETNVTLTGLTPETTYEAQVKSDCSDPEAWSNTVNFTTLEYVMPTQTIALSTGWNRVSFNVEITLNDLKAALVEAVPGTTIKISGQSNSTTYDPARNRWSGNLTWDLSKMYMIKVTTDCEITLQGDAIDPAEHPATIANGNNYIAFPLNQNMSLTNAFAGFAVNGDKVFSQTGSSTYTRGRWQGTTLTELEPGKGYIYKSAASENKTLVFPDSSK